MLYPGNGKPLFEQLKDQLTEKIMKEEYKEGDVLPSERVLAEKYRVSRVTVRQALASMAEDGTIVKRQGLGNFVALRHKSELERLQGFVEEFFDRHSNYSIRLLNKEFISAPAAIRSTLNQPSDEKTLLIVRQISVKDAPMGVDYTYIPEGIETVLRGIDFSQNIIYSFLERQNFQITHAEQTISAAIPTEEECGILNISPKTPVLVLKRTTYVRGGLPVIYNRTVYRSDRYSYRMTLNRHPATP